MNKLVFVENGQAVTDSLTVAEVFGKEHARVMRDIRELGCSEEFRVGNFAESTYVNSQNKEMPMYFMSKKGFTLLAMGYTGKEAMKFKEAYIDEFERMEDELKKPRPLSEREQLVAAMKLSLESAEELTQVKTEVVEVKSEVKEVRSMVENQITLDHGEQRRVQIGIASRIYELEKNKESRPPLFAELYREIRNRFGVTSYKDIKRKDMQAALDYIEAWVPRRVS
ncbi:Rha family transcriptional regulator [Neobacillus sp. 3P2-tot-E-2]|uniref:Rha family transcriptional regulator n=1 Tax=Neobacillus sp. 3P2-tot-E-2 TaxID=3132212 RepID=UPI00399FD91B